MKNIWKLIVAVAVSELAGVIGSVFTVSAIPAWYAGLIKPVLNPPSWVFGPVWTALYVLMGIAAFLVWSFDGAREEKKRALAMFGVQLLLNAVWSILFFGLHSPLLALIDIVMLWAAIVWTMIGFRKISKTAVYLLVPYIFWVSFATYLNFAIWFLN